MLEFEYPAGIYINQNMPIVLAMAEKIKEKNYKNLLFVCTGSSGAILSTIISLQLETPAPILYLRKEGESGHWHAFNTGYLITNTIVFIDDFIKSGDTFRAVQEKINKLGIYKIQAICLSDCDNRENIDESFYEEDLSVENIVV